MGTNVRTFVDDVVKIADSTWNTIKGFFSSKAGSTSTSTAARGTASAGAAAKRTTAGTSSARKPEDVKKEALKLLKDVSNMNPKPEVKTYRNVESGYDGAYYVRLSDGRCIEVRKYDNGTIELGISSDTTPDKKSDGTKFDGEEVMYEISPDGTIDEYINTDHSNSKFEVTNNLTKASPESRFLPAFIEKLFGEDYLPKYAKTTKQAQINSDMAKLRTTVKGVKKGSPAQARLDEANKMLAEVANMNPKPKVITDINNEAGDKWARVELPDGKWISVCKYNDGKVNVFISSDTTPAKSADGHEFDDIEVAYCFNNGNCTVNIDTDPNIRTNNRTFEYFHLKIKDNNYFDKMKAVLTKIFGTSIDL